MTVHPLLPSFHPSELLHCWPHSTGHKFKLAACAIPLDFPSPNWRVGTASDWSKFLLLETWEPTGWYSHSVTLSYLLNRQAKGPIASNWAATFFRGSPFPVSIYDVSYVSECLFLPVLCLAWKLRCNSFRGHWADEKIALDFHQEQFIRIRLLTIQINFVWLTCLGRTWFTLLKFL